jgi:hypothetical protein
MKCRIIVPFIASLALCASVAMAGDAPAAPSAPAAPAARHMGHGPWHMNNEDMAKHHAQRCSDRYAQAVGGLAYLETRLALTDSQKPLFERWRHVKLSSARAHSDECGTMMARDMDASIIDRLKMHEKKMKARLADLQAQMPSLEALVASLTDEQKHVLERTHEMFGDRMKHGMHGMMGRMHHGHGGGHDNDDNDAPPPPPPAE